MSIMVAALVAMVLLSGCKQETADGNQAAGGKPEAGGKQAAMSKLDAIKKAGKLVVYSNPEFPPYEYLGKDKAIVGCEIDIVNKIAERIGVKPDVVSAEFDSIIGTVQTGKADLGASGFTITDERKQLVDFSDVFDRSVQYLIVLKGSPIKVVEDLAGKTIGGQNGTTGFMMVEDAINKGVLKGTGAKIKSYNNAPDAVVAMKAGQLDAVVIDKLVAKALAKKNGMDCFEMLKKDGQGLAAAEEFGMIVAKGNEDLLAIVNEVINEMKKDGSYEKAADAHQEASSAEEGK
jgi:polar amino acid transport system substrate-binding protein